MTSVDQLLKVAEDIGYIRAAVERIEQRQDAASKTDDDHEERLGSLERSRSYVLGGAGAIGAVTGFLSTLPFGR